MRLTLVVVGSVRPPLATAVHMYEERVRRYWKLDLVEVDPGGPGASAPPPVVMEAEGDRILQRIPEGAHLVALTREAKGMTSRGLARWLGRLELGAHEGACFVIGGAYGLDPRVLARSRRRLSLSPMTLPHEMARLVLLEQLYRAGTIRRGEPYHKEP